MATTVTNKDGIEFDIDAIATDLNGKVDLDGTNATYPHIVSRTSNSQGGVVEIWSDGYCVQTGIIQLSTTSGTTINLVQAYKDTNYVVTCMRSAETNTTNRPSNSYFKIGSKTVNGFICTSELATEYCNYRTEGYIR